MKHILTIVLMLYCSASAFANDKNFEMLDVFELEYANDPQFSGDGKSIIYVRQFMDIMTDRKKSNLWRVDFNGKNHRPVTTGMHSNSSPRFSPNGEKLAYISTRGGKSQIYVRWLDTDKEFSIAQLQNGASNLSWAPDSSAIAFTQFVPEKHKTFVALPKLPKEAKWAKPAIYIDELQYRNDGRGFSTPGYTHVFVVPALGGTPRQITTGEFNHRSNIAWAKDGEHIYISANRHDDWKEETGNSEIYAVNVNTHETQSLTDRFGQTAGPSISPDGQLIAFSGYDDKRMGYHNSNLYVMNIDGSNIRNLTKTLDRSVGNIQWGGNSREVYFQYTDHGVNKIAKVNVGGMVTVAC